MLSEQALSDSIEVLSMHQELMLFISLSFSPLFILYKMFLKIVPQIPHYNTSNNINVHKIIMNNNSFSGSSSPIKATNIHCRVRLFPYFSLNIHKNIYKYIDTYKETFLLFLWKWDILCIMLHLFIILQDITWMLLEDRLCL